MAAMDADEALAHEVVGICRDVLGTAVIAAYGHGSATLGGLQHDSDVDVLVVVDRPLTRDERARIVDRLFDVSGRRARRGPARPVELTILRQADVRPWRFPTRQEFQYGEWLRSGLEGGSVPEPALTHDVAPLLTMVQRGRLTLFGPSPDEVLDPVPEADLIHAMAATIDDVFAGLEEDTRNLVLTLARVWTTVATGEIRSKDGAADWVLERLPEEHRTVLEHARAIYLGETPETWPRDLRARVRPHAEHVAAEIRRLLDGRRS